MKVVAKVWHCNCVLTDMLCIRRAGKHQLVVLERGPLLLVAASMLGEPIQVLSLHLELLHGQIVSILTRAFERRFQRDPGFDARTLLGQTQTWPHLHLPWGGSVMFWSRMHCLWTGPE